MKFTYFKFNKIEFVSLGNQSALQIPYFFQGIFGCPIWGITHKGLAKCSSRQMEAMDILGFVSIRFNFQSWSLAAGFFR